MNTNIFVVLIWIRFLFVSSSSLDNRDQIWITKCCASSEKYDLGSRSCIPDENPVQFDVDTVILNIEESNWIEESNSIPHEFRYEWCSGNITRNYRVTQTGALIEYTGEKSYYQFYNKYCVDVDHKTGEKIAVICNDRLVVKKCCGLTSILTEQSHNNFECQPTENAVYLNDLSAILFGDEEKRNVEFDFDVKYQLKNRRAVKLFGLINFAFDEDQKITKFDSQTDFCVDKLNDHWIFLVENDETVFIVIALVIFFSLLVLFAMVYLRYILKRKISGKHKLFNTCADVCSSKNPRMVS
jgi:hypothetical protein